MKQTQESQDNVTKILFVCTGNICRSPAAEGVFRALADRAGKKHRFSIDSAGTHDYHVGEKPDPRTRTVAKRRGIDLSRLRGRQVQSSDFETFDLIVAMDRTHLRLLKQRCPSQHIQKIHLFLDHLPGGISRDVPDPYYGTHDDFEDMFDLIEKGAQGLWNHLLPP